MNNKPRSSDLMKPAKQEETKHQYIENSFGECSGINGSNHREVLENSLSHKPETQLCLFDLNHKAKPKQTQKDVAHGLI